jgi:hypothetical protein
MRSSRFLHPLLLLLQLVGTAAAHPSLQDSMWVLFAPDRIRVAVNVSLRELLVAQQVAESDDETFDTVRVNAAAEKHREYVLEHLQLTAGGRKLSGQVTALTPPELLSSAERTFFQYTLEYPLTAAPPASVTFSHEMLREFPYAPGQSWDVSYVVRVKREGSDEVSSWLLRFGQPSEIPTGWEAASAQASHAADADGWRVFREYLRHGVMHILTGYDHLLFVAALVLATLSFLEMVKVIAAFTAAHTLTLALSVFDIFRLPPSIVEPVIALSIVFVALENVFFPRRAHSRVRLVVAFGFGLVHGLGFAGGLLDAMAGLPAIGIWTALIAFSVGVELGHQVVVLPLFGLLALGRSRLRESIQGPILRYGSTLISACGVYYLCVSLHQQFFAH